MASLFDLPSTRSNRGADKNVVNKSTNKRSAPVVVRGGGNLLEQISSITSLVEQKLGKYKKDYICIMEEDVLSNYVDKCIENGIVSIDTETTGLDPMLDEIVGFSLYTPNEKAAYIPINHVSYITGMPVEGQLTKEVIKPYLDKFNNPDVKIIMFNAKFDMRVLNHQLDVKLKCYFDGYLAGKLLNENEPSGGLKALHSKYVLEGKEDEWNFGKLFGGIDFRKVPIKTAFVYAARDAIDTYELYQFQLPYLTKGTEECTEQGLERVSDVFWNIEMPCIEVLANMEDNGIAFDFEYAEKLSKEYHAKRDKIMKDFYKACDMYKDEITMFRIKNPNNKLGTPINISSPTQLSVLFYDILKLDAGVDKKTGKQIRGTGDDILARLSNPVVDCVREYRKVDKLLSTYIDKLPSCVNPVDNRIHCNFNQYGAKTGRMSSDNPNMQNIPSHNHDIRKMFVAEPGNVLLSSDYSQQEPKAMACMCQDPKMIQAYVEGKDLYASIASLAFDKPYDDCLEFRPDGTTNKEGKERRSSAKSILLGILYGRGIASVAEQLNTTTRKAQNIQDKIFKGFPSIKQFEDDTVEMAKEQGFVTTYWGRKRRLPEMQLNEFEFKWMEGYGDDDPLSFDMDTIESEVPDELVRKYTRKLRNHPFKKRSIIEEAKHDGILITDNGGKIADATRQCVNSRIQGSAADLTKLAGIEILKNERLKELGFKLLVPIHDEFLAECPLENAKECAELFSKCMADAARDMNIPISTDVTISREWYGREIEV